MDLVGIFVRAVKNADDIPARIRQDAASVIGLRESTFDESYIAFLDKQIVLCPRGPEWQARLSERRHRLHEYCGKPLLSGRIHGDGIDVSILVDAVAVKVVHWEHYEE